MRAAGWELVDRALPNLGNGHLGRSYTYASHGLRFQAFSGVEALEAYEDLDFTSAEVSVGGTQAQLFTAGAFGTADDLLVLTWKHPDVDGPCGDRTAVGTNLSESELLTMAVQVSS